MKRILTVAALLLLVVCMTLALASCDMGVSVDDAKDDPAQVLADALSAGTSDFFTLDAEIDKKIADAMTSGSVTLALDENEALQQMVGLTDFDIKAILYANDKTQQYALEIDADIAGESVDGVLFINEDKIALVSRTLLGSSKAYAFTPSVFLSKFEGSALKSALGIDNETASEVLDAFRSANECFNNLFNMEEYNEKLSERTKKLFEAFDYGVSEREIDGEDMIVMSLVINSETIDDAVNMLTDEDFGDGFEEEILEELEDLVVELQDNAEIDATVAIYLDKKNGALRNVDLDFTATPTDDEYEGESVTGEVSFSITESKLVLDANIAGELEEDSFDYSFTIECDKKVDGDKVTYDLTLDVVADGFGQDIDTTLVTAQFVYDKGDGDFELEIEGDGKIVDFSANLEGNVKVDGNAVTIVIEEVGANSMSLEIGLEIKFEKGVAVPEVPADAKEIVELTEEEVLDFRRIRYSRAASAVVMKMNMTTAIDLNF